MILTTTGTSATVTITGLRDQNNQDLELTHPQTIDLLVFYDSEDLEQVASAIQAEIDAGTITAQNQDGEPITDVAQTTADVSNLNQVAFTGDYNDLNNLPSIPADVSGDISTLQTEQTEQNSAIGMNAAGIMSLELVTSNIDNTSDVDKPVSTAQQAAIDSAVSSHESETDPHSQYLTQAEGDGRYIQILPNQVIRYPEPSAANAGVRFTPIVNATGDGYEFFREFVAFARRTDPLAHQSSATFQEYLTLNVDIPEDGDYELTVSYRWSMNSARANFLAHVLDETGAFLFPLHIEPADSAGVGEVVATSTGGTVNTGTDQFQRVSHEDILPLTAGPKSYRLEFRGQFANLEPTIYEALIKLKRIRADV